MNTRFNAKTLAGVGILTAIVIVLQIVSNHIAIWGVSLTLVLVPIVVGAALYGIWAAAWLGFVFAVVVLFSPSTQAVFFSINPAATIGIVFLKGIAAGVVSALAYRLLAKKNRLAAVILAAIVCPITNTGIFAVGAYWFFQSAFTSGSMAFWPFMGVLFTIIGVNFLVEFGLNLILSPTVVQIIHIIRRSRS